MASITVDVSLDDFDLDELLEEIQDRYYYPQNKVEIEQWGKDMFEVERFNVELSLIDQIKIDFLIHNLDKIKLNDLENLI